MYYSELQVTSNFTFLRGGSHNMIGPKINHYNELMSEFRNGFISDKTNK